MVTNKTKPVFVVFSAYVLVILGLGLVSACNMQLTKSVDKDTAELGETLVFTLAYENIGSSNCTGGGIKIQDILDENLLYDGEYSVNIQNDTDGEGFYYGWQEIPGYNATTKTLTWNVYTVSPGEKGTITFEVIILEREECGDFEISNFFRAWSDQEEWKESNTIIVNVKDECPPEPFCGDDICNNGETCSTCPEDCGACPPIPPCDCCPCPGCYISDCYCSTNECDCGGEVIINPEEEDEEECNEKCEDEEECNEDNSDNLKIFCETNWKCSQWGECVNGFITRECFDENQCDTVYNKPYEQSACNEQVLSTQYVEKKVANLNWIWIALGIILFIALLIILILLIA